MAIIVKGGGGKPEEQKTVTAGTSVIEVLPSSGKVMKKVTVNPTPTESKSVTPTTSELTVTPSVGKHLSQVVVGAVEDVTPEVTAQTPVITHIAENLGVTITTPSGTNKQILQGNNANLLNIKNNAKKEGAYVWIKLTAEGGDFLDYVVSDSETAYPDGGYKSGYWYKLYCSPVTSYIVSWANGTDEEIVKMVQLADAGIINLSDYWSVGDIRTVQLSAMSATGVGESHSAQSVDLVLMHAGGYELNEAVASGRTKCSFIVGQKDSLAIAGYMNSSADNFGSWNSSARRAWCNSVYKNALPSTLLPIFKQFKTITIGYNSGSENKESVDYFALPAAKEVFGGSASSAGVNTCYSNLTEFNALFQFDYYKTTSNRIKNLGKAGNAYYWWERSPHYNNSTRFCLVDSGGTAYFNGANVSNGLAPFGCI